MNLLTIYGQRRDRGLNGPEGAGEVVEGGHRQRVADARGGAAVGGSEARPGGPGEADFKLLGLTGEKRIFLSPELRVPLMLTGTIENVGKGRIKLKRVYRD